MAFGFLSAIGQAKRAAPWNSEEAIREELFSVQRLEQHATSLAAAQDVSVGKRSARSLSARLRENESVLLEAYIALSGSVEESNGITPAAEWLLDNYHVVEEQIREIRDDLPTGFYRQLPKLASGPLRGFPRVFGIAWAFVAHTDSHFDAGMLRRFVQAYQRVQPLTIGELWAVAITLRIVLVENLRRGACRIIANRAWRAEADLLADRLLNGTPEEHSGNRMRQIFQHYEKAPLPAAFAVRLMQRLRDQDPKVTRSLAWLHERLAAQTTNAEQIVHDEHQRQGATNVTVRNIINSMRSMSDVDWPEFFEDVSLVDGILRQGSSFADMDFGTRNLYRNAIEEIARGSLLSELQVSQAAVAAASTRTGSEASPRLQDPGYHLIAAGRREFERTLRFRVPARDWPRRFIARTGVLGYAGSIGAVAGLIAAVPLLALGVGFDAMQGWQLAMFSALALIPAIDAATPIVNRMVTGGFRAMILPGLALRDGIPAHLRTLVAVPVLLTSETAIDQLVDRLETHYLASDSDEIYFALLSDWTDADAESLPGDNALLHAAAAGLARLNLRYGPGASGARFLLLHRRRVWNAGQQRWIGWERKRGKLHELNRLLRGSQDTSFLSVAGVAPAVPAGVRYVITLDSDTRLPRDTARRLIAKMAHPLNAPRFDDARRVVEGYAILQPRVSPSLPIGREGSHFQRVFSSASGIDPYAAAVSDVYQDLFGEGSYTGKGIYEVDAFESALNDRVADSSLLSHDLFEGTFARSGLASDIEVVEEFPARYDESASRQHRWARGDWQLLPWILGRGHSFESGVDARRSVEARARRPAGPMQRRNRNRLPAIGRWKMLDNLRRNLSAPASLIALIAGFSLPLEGAAIWTGFILAAIVLPALLPVLGAALPRRIRSSIRSHCRALATEFQVALCLSGLIVALLAHQAWLMTDAACRTLYRLLISRRHLLDWVAAGGRPAGEHPDLALAYRKMNASVAAGIAAFAVVWVSGGESWPVAIPLILAWVAAPAIALWTSLAPPDAGHQPVSDLDARALRAIARRTWRFFETFVTKADHFLPPDNFQEDPRPVVAHRTSPTNLGLYLLSVASARDFGWSGMTETVERLEQTLATMNRLERFRGHYYNWYDTQDLRPLEPRYVSSVDSGNLAGHLIALANVCREWAQRPAPGIEALAGLADALVLAREHLAVLVGLSMKGPGEDVELWSLLHAVEELTAELPLGLPRTVIEQAGPGALPASPDHDPVARLARLAPRVEAIATAARGLAEILGEDATGDLLYWTQAAVRTIESHLRDQPGPVERSAMIERLGAIERSARRLGFDMQFGFLLDPERRLLSIGYRVAEGSLDPSCYDLLASEARLASFIAIAKGDIPSRHWFRLGRTVAPVGNGAALLSWSGSMFEYLMPSLVMRAPRGSLIEQTSRLIVGRQITYGAELNVPWGISESAYNVRDVELTYQYSNFGVPGLGLKRGLSGNAVIAPYATALAAMVDAHAAALNFTRLALAGTLGRYGYYEALDYTRSRLPAGQQVAIVRAFMAHHQGMTLVSIANALLDGAMRTRFHAEPSIRATELLLQERTPRDVALVLPRAFETNPFVTDRQQDLPSMRRKPSAHGATPEAHLLSNGNYTVMLTAAGSGYSRLGNIALTRWREDATCDDWGSHIYLRDTGSGRVWSAGYQPCRTKPDEYEVSFSEDRACFIRRDGTVTTTLEVLVSPEHDAEVRRITLTNSGKSAREFEITSCAELVLAPAAQDAAHPAFSKLFVQTELSPDSSAILATRRRRSPADPEVWIAHLAVVEGDTIGALEIETDRARFLGRGNETNAPIAIMEGRPLTNTVGTVLDPVFAMRRRIRVPPGRIARIAYWTVTAGSRAELLDLIDKHGDATAYERTATLAWTQAQVQLGHLGLSVELAEAFQRLASAILYSDPVLRPSREVIARGQGGPSALWAHGISGDLPIVLVRIENIEDLRIVREMLQAHEYWRSKHLAADLVILNERAASYDQDLQVAIETLMRTVQTRSRLGSDPARGSIFLLRAGLVSDETRAVLLSTCRAVINAGRGALTEQFNRLQEPQPTEPIAMRHPALSRLEPEPAHQTGLEFFNGYGGFSQDGREYVTQLGTGGVTPAPWINVIANPSFGFLVSAEGGGCTWADNSRDNQLTPWSNDAVADRPGEVFYLRDTESGELWGPSFRPTRNTGAASFIARHGQGYSRFETRARGIELDLLQYVPLADPVKISRLRIRNTTQRPRRLSITGYVEWVLGTTRGASTPTITTGLDEDTGALLARNPWNAARASHVAFSDMGGRQTSWTTDRREFIGRNGALDAPAALRAGAQLSGRTGAGLDPCAALQASIELPPGGEIEILFLLGEAKSLAAAQGLIRQYRKADLAAVLASVTDYWDSLLGAVQVSTPDRSMDIMLNRWLLYQTLACRIWARAAFYQASGAYGFRDQLQDGMALTLTRPALTRTHLLRAAARQFVEGDVQHWWIEPLGQGVRTRNSDDRVWLAYAAASYVETAGDVAILDESIPFIEGQMLRPGEADAYFEPLPSAGQASLFEHCARGLDMSLATGRHGLPLIGTGDWNDGMNRVGQLGSGESVWLGWLLYATLNAFAPLALARNQAERASTWLAHAAALQSALESAGWDGGWYRRGYYDDGTPLGAAESEECRIDAIAQSWAVISRGGRPDRARIAMEAVDAHLTRHADGLSLLFAPPFDRTTLDPGYVKSYPPGIRENGGQYTHASTWSAIACAQLGDGDRAVALFRMLNPVNRALTPVDAARYALEPYALAADVYSAAPHTGRGGWSWYTGSAGWLYRTGIESILGLRVQGAWLLLAPCIPKAWPHYEMTFAHGSARYAIRVENPDGVSAGIARATLDGIALEAGPIRIALRDDGSVHTLHVVLG